MVLTGLQERVFSIPYNDLDIIIQNLSIVKHGEQDVAQRTFY